MSFRIACLWRINSNYQLVFKNIANQTIVSDGKICSILKRYGNTYFIDEKNNKYLLLGKATDTYSNQALEKCIKNNLNNN